MKPIYVYRVTKGVNVFRIVSDMFKDGIFCIDTEGNVHEASTERIISTEKSNIKIKDLLTLVASGKKSNYFTSKKEAVSFARECSHHIDSEWLRPFIKNEINGMTIEYSGDPIGDILVLNYYSIDKLIKGIDDQADLFIENKINQRKQKKTESI